MNTFRRRRATSLIELLVVIGILATLAGLLLSAVQNVRQAANRVSCADRMRQLGIALHQAHDTTSHLPSGLEPANARRPFLTWRAQILPWIEQESLWRLTEAAYAVDRFPFHNPPHVALATVVPAFACPSDPRLIAPQQSLGYTAAYSSYLGVSGTGAGAQDGSLFMASRVGFLDISDGTSNTIILGERPPSADLYYGWWYAGKGLSGTGTADSILSIDGFNPIPGRIPCPRGPYAFTGGTLDNQCDMFHFWSLHPGGAHFLFADNSLRFISYSGGSLLAAFATRAGGEISRSP